MDKIPINFEHHGKKFSGQFGKVQGAGNTSVWHLMSDDHYYLGRLRIGWQDQWYFDGSRPENKLEELAQFFGEYVTAWIG
jgi:hypothetical protein